MATKKTHSTRGPAGQAPPFGLLEVMGFMPDPTFAIDLDGRVVMWNRAMEELTGITARTILGSSDYGYSLPFYGHRRPLLVDLALHPDPKTEEGYYSLVRRGDTLYAEGFAGTLKRIFWAKASPVRDKRGTVVGAMESVRDISGHKEVENELRRSEARYRDVFMNVSDYLYILDMNGAFIEANLAARKGTGYSEEELKRLTVKDLLPGRYRHLYGPYMERVLSRGYDEGLMTFVTKTGQELTLAYRNSLILDKDGKVMGIRGSSRDITERRQAKELLRQSEERFSKIFHTAPNTIVITRISDGMILDVNPGFEAVTGYPRTEVIGRTSLSLDLWADPSQRDAMISELQEKGEALFREFTFRRRDGVLRTGLYSARTMAMAGEPCLVFLMQDVTESRQAQEALRRSEERFRMMAQASPEIFWMATPDWSRVVYVSPAFDRILGIPSEEVYRDPMAWLNRVHPHDRRLLCSIVGCNPEKDSEYEFRIIRPDGGIRWVRNRRSPVLDPCGAVICLIGIAEDITEKKLAEEERRGFESRMMHSQKLEAIGTLAGGIAHDFNNILSAIIGYTELAKDDLPGESPVRAILDEVLRAGDRARDLVSQILTFSRRTETELRPVRIQPILKETLKLLRSSIPSTITITDSIDASARPVMADPVQIHQVIMNLCTNAYHAMMPLGGRLAVSLDEVVVDSRFASLHSPLKEGPHTKITVHDTGCGIDQDILPRIFDPFFTTKEKGKGTGLGLSTVHGIVTGLEGVVAASSVVAEGSTFEVYIPVTEEAPDEISEFMEALPRGGGESILLVDDEEAILQIATTLLESLGYRVTTASSGLQALEIFRSAPESFALIITDETMPGMTGSSLASEVLTIRPGMPLILMTGYSETVTRDQAMALGIRRYIEKPFTKSSLAREINSCLCEDIRKR